MRKPPDPPIDDESDASPIDMRSLTFLGLWGGAAAAGLLVVAVATHTESGQRRLALAFSGGTAPVAAVEERRTTTRDAEIENRRLSDQLRNLSEDRDRLLARMTVLERNYEDVTGSIGRLANPPKPVLPELSPQPAPPQASSALQAVPVPPQAEVAQVASAPAMVPERGASPAPARPAPQAVAPQAVAPEPIEGISARTEFGVDLGGAPSVAALRNAWERIRRTHGVQLEGLRPVIGIRDGRTGQVELRLVVGPITNAGAAAKLCAALANAGLSCQPTTFDGQRLALR
jgi:hypothetical protein